MIEFYHVCDIVNLVNFLRLCEKEEIDRYDSSKNCICNNDWEY